MQQPFLLPELAESVVEGEVVRWLVAEGDAIAADQPLVEVMTDKVTVELPAPFAGRLLKIVAMEGALVPVGGVLALVDAANASRGASAEAAETQDAGDTRSLFRAQAPSSDAATVTVVRRQGNTPRPRAATNHTPPAIRGAYGRVAAVPAARRLARELGIDIEHVPGSGPGGRVRREDVEAFTPLQASTAGATPTAPRPLTPAGFEARERRVPLRGLRRAITQQMLASHLHTVRTLHVEEANVAELVRWREELMPRALAHGVKLSYLPIIMKALAAVLPEHPAITSALDEATQEIVYRDYVNLGVAVATEAGLVVPVVRDVDQRSLLDVARALQTLAGKAREGKLESDDVRGGTFTVSNIGSVGGLFSFPIINAPEAAILGVHSIRKRPVVLADDSIAARPMLYLSLSFDHRLIDGAEAARFTQALIDVLEAPQALLLGV